MEAPNLHQEMLQYFIQLNEEEKKSVLQMIKTFLQGKIQPPTRISIKQYNKDIDNAMLRMDAGEFISQETLENDAGKW